ncbi:hypothetical protein U1Q18_049472 [Sarracenia purpurea var. burkii]
MPSSSSSSAVVARIRTVVRRIFRRNCSYQFGYSKRRQIKTIRVSGFEYINRGVGKWLYEVIGESKFCVVVHCALA